VTRTRTNLALPSNDGREYVLKTWDAAYPAAGVAGVRITSDILKIVRSGHRLVGLPSPPEQGYTGFLVMFSTVTARPVALLHDAYLARLSTSVAAVLAMKYLAAVNASVLAMLGAGRQAREQLPLIKAVLQLAEVRVYHPIEKKR